MRCKHRRIIFPEIEWYDCHVCGRSHPSKEARDACASQKLDNPRWEVGQKFTTGNRFLTVTERVILDVNGKHECFYRFGFLKYSEKGILDFLGIGLWSEIDTSRIMIA